MEFQVRALRDMLGQDIPRNTGLVRGAYLVLSRAPRAGPFPLSLVEHTASFLGRPHLAR